MSLRDFMRDRFAQPGAGRANGSDGGATATAPADATAAPADAPVPYEGYESLDDREVVAGLSDHSQVELTAVDAYERSHKDRVPVLNKLRFLRRQEPVPGYDALGVEEIVALTATADVEILDRIRSYERNFANRPKVLEEVIERQRVLRAAKPKEAVPAYQPASAKPEPASASAPSASARAEGS